MANFDTDSLHGFGMDSIIPTDVPGSNVMKPELEVPFEKFQVSADQPRKPGNERSRVGTIVFIDDRTNKCASWPTEKCS